MTVIFYVLQKVDTGEENSPAAPAGTRTRDLSITSSMLDALTTELSLLPQCVAYMYIIVIYA